MGLFKLFKKQNKQEKVYEQNKQEKELIAEAEKDMKTFNALMGFYHASEKVGLDVVNKKEDALKAIVIFHETYIELIEKDIGKKLSRDSKIYLMVSGLGEFLLAFDPDMQEYKLNDLMRGILDKDIKLSIDPKVAEDFKKGRGL